MGEEMNETGQRIEINQKKIFAEALNRQGYPFQYAVIRRAQELEDETRSPWVFEAAEFPVEVQSYHTRIDFVLSNRRGTDNGYFRYLVAECKRANPALHDWLFTRAPYVRRGGVPKDILFESIRREGNSLTASLSRLDGDESIYHVPVEVKGGAKGDAISTGRGAIEEAATQVIRGVNGLIECLSKNQRYLPENCPINFIPVIFTTAKIWATDIDIASDVTTGQVALGSNDVVDKPWLWLQYHVSPGLKHGIDRQVSKEEPYLRHTLGDLLELEYARTIAIVGSEGIDAFLSSHCWK
ncbi:MAG: hypothetical protein WA121_05640 [Syntrophales bacterium]